MFGLLFFFFWTNKKNFQSKNFQSKNKPQKSNKKRFIPDVIYAYQNEYNITATKKADPSIPIEFFIVKVGFGSPKQPNPFFKSFSFPIENRRLEISFHKFNEAHSIHKKYSSNSSQPINSDRVNKQLQTSNLQHALLDFHFLWFLNTKLDSNSMKQILSYLETKKNESEVKNILQTLAKSLSPTTTTTTSKPTTPTPTSQPTKLSQEINAQVKQIMEMGFTETQAREALKAANGDVHLALNFLVGNA